MATPRESRLLGTYNGRPASSILTPASGTPRVTQPREAPLINPSLATSLVGAWVPGLGDVTGKRPEGYRGFDQVGRAGLAYWLQHANYNSHTLGGDVSKWLATSGGTTVMVLQEFGTSQNAYGGVGVQWAGEPVRMCHVACVSGTAYWCYGGQTNGTTRLQAATDTTAGTLGCFVATTGPGGMTIHRDGLLLASNSANPTRNAAAGYSFFVGDTYATGSGSNRYYLVAVWNRKLPAAVAQDLSRNPWKLFVDPPGLQGPLASDYATRPAPVSALLMSAGTDVLTQTAQPQGYPNLVPDFGTLFAYLPAGGNFYDVGTKRLGNIRAAGANGQPSVFRGGRSLLFAQSNSHGQWLTQPGFKPATSDFWVLVQGTFVPDSTAVVALSNYTSGVAAPSNQWRLQPNYNGSGLASGSFAFLTYDLTNNFLNAGASSLFSAGEVCTFLGLRRGSTVELWKNGALVASNSGTVRNVSGSNAQEVGFSVLEGTFYTAGGHRSLAAGGLGPLTAAEASALSRNPWQLFAAPPSAIWTPR